MENSFKLFRFSQDDESDLGSSHVLGCPDVPSDWNDNQEFYNDEVFLAQFNCSNLGIEGLPKEGMLYFFYAASSKPIRGIVRYAPQVENLERIDFNIDSPVPSLANFEYDVKKGNSKIVLCDECKLVKDYTLKKDEIVLFRFNTQEYPELSFLDEYEKEICYIIKQNDLNNKNFHNAFLAFNLEK